MIGSHRAWRIYENLCLGSTYFLLLVSLSLQLNTYNLNIELDTEYHFCVTEIISYLLLNLK